jgi:alpha-ribazole phosphatase/probable phosphoglycerate mutase
MKNFVNIIYFVHGTTTDNENKISTGWNPGELSDLGIKQSRELWGLVKDRKIDVVYSSDLRRAIDSAKYCFEGKVPIFIDKRLRECNYGDLNGAKSEIVLPMRKNCIDKPFPNGESYKDVEDRITSLLDYILEKHPGGDVALVAHMAPQIALDVIVNNKTWEQAFKDYWGDRKPKVWQPGWDFRYER